MSTPLEVRVRECTLLQSAATECVERLEKGLGSPDTADAKIGAALAIADELLSGAHGTLDAPQRRRVDHAADELRSLRDAVGRQRRRAARIATSASDRDQLLRNRGAGASHHVGGGGGSATAVLDNPDAEAMNHLAKERQSLDMTRTRVDAMTAESLSILKALEGQRQRFTSTEDKLVGYMQALGVGDQAIATVKRVVKQDRAIAAGGVVILLLLMAYIWFK